MTNPIDLDALEALLAQATPGPWLRHNNPKKWVSTLAPITDAEWAENRDNDADYIVALHNAAPALIAMARKAEKLEAENARLKTPCWFYHPDYTETCEFSSWEVVEYYDLEPGKYIVEIQTAKPLPSIWSVVHVFTDDEKAALGEDEDWATQDFATEDQARAALGEQP